MERLGQPFFLVGIILTLGGMFLFLYSYLILLKNKKGNQIVRSAKGRFAILIPARDESKVIRGILTSLLKQTDPVLMEDIYVIVESEQDPSVKITKEFGASVIIREHLNLKRKGYALDEAVKQILNHGQKYDAYFIFDADNILDPNFMQIMRKRYQEGYDVAIGYRQLKNGNENVIAAASGLIFSILNTLRNQYNMDHHGTLIVSGTGFFISGDWIEKWQGYPFHSLTEDYELTLYATGEQFSMVYEKEAIFYDEQPTTYQQTKIQRIRWIRGFFDARKEYIPKLKKKIQENPPFIGSLKAEIIGIKPIIMMVIGIVLLLLDSIITIPWNEVFHNSTAFLCVLFALAILLFLYFCLMLVTAILLYLEKDRLLLSRKMRIKTLFFHPLFLLTYIPCLFQALGKKEIRWEKVEHKQSILEKEKGIS